MNGFKLGFKNFRKFKVCPPIDISGVTCLVGKNNSGKSTYVKGLLLLHDNKKTIFEGCDDICHPKFSFKSLDAGIFTYSRALHRNAESNEIVFAYRNIEIGVSGDIEVDTESAPITYIKFRDYFKDWHFDFVNQTINCEINLIGLRDSISSDESHYERELKSGMERREEIQKILDDTKDGDLLFTQTTDDDCDYIPKPYEKGWEEFWEKHNKWDYFMAKLQEVERKIASWQVQANDFLMKKNQKIEAINSYIGLQKNTNFSISVPFPTYGGKGKILDLQSQVWKHAHAEEYNLQNQLSALDIGLIEKLEVGKEFIDITNEYYEDYRDGWSGDIEYIPARDTPRNIVFMADDANRAFGQTIHNYCVANQKYIKSSSEKYRAEALHRFVQFWLKEFEIGVDFRIEAIAERSYTCQILNKEGDWVHLAEMGRGATQLILLLLQVTAIFIKHGFENSGLENSSRVFPINSCWNSNYSLIVIEEPEQNLHPALQSKLADFFCSISRTHGYLCLIETHSEYLIRRAQVIVGTKRFRSLDFYSYSNYDFKTGEVHEGIICQEENDYILQKNPFHIYYFPHDEWANSGGDPELPYEMGFREDGFFEKSFGPGFFDEASKWHLLLLNNSNNK